MQNIIAVLFKNESEGFQAITELRQDPIASQYTILQTALVKRSGEQIKYCDGFDTGLQEDHGAAIGGLMGSLLGILGGPLGVLMMGSYGALAGGAIGSVSSLDNALLVEAVASKLVDGEVALIALAEEEDEAALDAKFNKFQVEIARFDAARVAAEVDEAEDLQREKDRLELEDLRKAKKEEIQAAIEDKRAKLSADFHAAKEKVKEAVES